MWGFSPCKETLALSLLMNIMIIKPTSNRNKPCKRRCMIVQLTESSSNIFSSYTRNSRSEVHNEGA